MFISFTFYFPFSHFKSAHLVMILLCTCVLDSDLYAQFRTVPLKKKKKKESQKCTKISPPPTFQQVSLPIHLSPASNCESNLSLSFTLSNSLSLPLSVMSFTPLSCQSTPRRRMSPRRVAEPHRQSLLLPAKHFPFFPSPQLQPHLAGRFSFITWLCMKGTDKKQTD